MKGPAKRFVNNKGKAYDVDSTRDPYSIGFLDLWRYSTWLERSATVCSVVLACVCAAGFVAAVVSYGELTSLFVQRHKAAHTTPHAHILHVFNGGRVLMEGNRTAHMDALLEDSLAFGLSNVAIMATQLVCAAIAVNVVNWAASRMVDRLRCRLLENVLRQEIAFFDTNTSLNFATTITEDVEKLRAGVGEQVVMTSYLGSASVLAVALSLWYGWQLTLAGIAIIPIAVLVATVVAKYQTRCATKEVTAYSRAARVVEEALAGVRTVRAYAGEDLEVQRYVEAMGEASRSARRRGLWAGAGTGLGWLLTYSLNTVVFAYGAELCVRDMLLPPDDQLYHPGVMVTVLFCSYLAAQNIAMLQPHLEIFSTARGAARSIYKLLERRSAIDPLLDTGLKPDKIEGNIVFDNIYFNYPSRPDVKVLRGLSLRVRAGETVALVGTSGCGKSTLLQLLQRLYEPASGNITLDGHKLRDLNLHRYRSTIGVVGQEPVLFAGTIRENITLGMEHVSEEALVAAAELAHAHQFITKLANGYDTLIGERGCSLSGGQKQRVAIARAVLRRPALLLLDEPTSALDPGAERQVQAALDNASKGRTTLVVSHRLSTIVNASRIVMVQQGAVLEQGSHAELLEQRGAYWKLVQEDLTNKSIENNVTSATEVDDDVVKENDCQEHFHRTISRRSTRESLKLRASFRMTAPTLAPHVVLDHANEVDLPAAEEGCEDAESASMLALLRLNAPEWPLLLCGGIASFFVGATMPAFALLFSKLYGMFASSDGAEVLRQSRLYAALFGGTAALCGIVCFLQAWLFNRAGAKLTERLRMLTFRNFLRQEQAWFDLPENGVGALSARLAADCAAVQGATGTRLGTVLQGVSTMVIGVSVAFAYSWKNTLVSLVSVPFVIGGIYLEGVVSRAGEQRSRCALEAAARRAGEAVTHVRTVQSLGVERALLSQYRCSLADGSRGAFALVRGLVYGLCLCAPTLGYAVSLSYAGYLIAREDMQYEYAILVSEALVYGAWMLAEALSFAPDFAAARAAGSRVLRALARQPAVTTAPEANERPHWNASGEVDFKSIEFSYPTRAATVLRGLTLHVRAGETVALVGASGCGKSTLLQLLLRYYDPDSGTVALDGHDIRNELTVPQLRAQLGLVQQEPVLFDRSIRENIAYGDNSREVPLEEIIDAAKQANVHTFIASLPLGYETRLGSGASALSGGQKQRVSIARALVRRPALLLLDEATSALDAASEKAVASALEAAARGRSTLVVAHRLATVQRAHRICVLHKGVVAESGTHDELVRQRGHYWQLLQQQAPALA